MRKKSLLTVPSEAGPQVSNGLGQTSLHDEVRQALLAIIRDEGANAAAKASAARTLLEYFADSKPHANSNARGVELTAAELDAMIAQLRD